MVKGALSDFYQLSLLQKVLLLLLLVAAIVSVNQGWENAKIYSNDFQWSPTVLFAERENPYRHYLEGNRDQRIFGSQAPNYAHAIYVLLSPLSLLEWEDAKRVWAFLNIGISIWIALYIVNVARMNRVESIIVLLLFLCSTPFRNSVGNGQQSLMILFAALFVLKRSNTAYIVAGISYLKYSFAPPVALYLLLRGGWKALVWSLLIPGMGFLIFWAYQGDKAFFSLLMQPLAVNALSVGVGLSDYMTIVSLVFDEKSGLLWGVVYYLFTVLFSMFITYWVLRDGKDPLLGFAAISIVCLLFFKHLVYDYVFLLPAFVVFVKCRNAWYAKVGLFAVLYFWFGIRIAVFFSQSFTFLEEFLLLSRFFNFALLIVILLLLTVGRIDQLKECV